MKNAYTCFIILITLYLTTPNLAVGKLYPLEVADTSSPRATLKSFQTLYLKARPILDKMATSGLSPEIVSALRMCAPGQYTASI